uniref:hypothetical protein n=1 Tax=Ahnfeltia fastigiata TaxID=31363 RepID=UPI001D0FADEA|nr:hypothetical protein LK038_pgp136 [Ahnfeltia fastigiata]UAT97626.1 hypothetical protein Ahn.fas.Ore.pt_086 [Ahnfeltia fastigiata]
MPRIYLTILILFLLPICFIITMQLIKLIMRENIINSSQHQNEGEDFSHEYILVIAQIYIEKKMWFSCISMIESKLNSSVQFDPKYYNCIGFCYYNAKKYGLAKDYYNNAININPYYTLALSNLAKTYRNMGDKEKSKLVYNRILKYDPDNLIAKKGLRAIN